jgi:RNA-binding protein
MPLTSKQNRYLRGLAHKLKPIVMVGDAGVTEGVINELDNSLEHHELIKVRISGMDRAERTASAKSLAEQSHSELVNIIGHIAILYRRSKKPQIKLPS